MKVPKSACSRHTSDASRSDKELLPLLQQLVKHKCVAQADLVAFQHIAQHADATSTSAEAACRIALGDALHLQARSQADRQGLRDDARRQHQLALAVCAALPDYAAYVTRTRHIAVVEASCGAPASAAAHLHMALSMARCVPDHGARRVLKAEARHSLGKLLLETGDLVGSRVALRKALVAYRAKLGLPEADARVVQTQKLMGWVCKQAKIKGALQRPRVADSSTAAPSARQQPSRAPVAQASSAAAPAASAAAAARARSIAAGAQQSAPLAGAASHPIMATQQGAAARAR